MRHDDHQVAFRVQSQQCCCKGLATRDIAKRELVDASQVRLTSVLQPQFDGQSPVDDVNVGTVSSPFLQKQDFGDLSTEKMSDRGGVGQERRCWSETSCTTLLRGRPVPGRLEGIAAIQVAYQDVDHEEQHHCSRQ